MSVGDALQQTRREQIRRGQLLAHRHKWIILSTLGIPLRQPLAPPLRDTDTRRLTSRGDGERGGGDTLDVRDFLDAARETARSPVLADSSR